MYIEPYCGSATVFFSREKVPNEILNDIDYRIVNFFRVLQSREKSRELLRLLRRTPTARAEFDKACYIIDHSENASDIELAWGFFVASILGISRLGRGTSIRRSGLVRGSRNMVSNDFINKVRALPYFAQRLKDAFIENTEALKVLRRFDCKDAVIYLDPPYVHSTRSSDRYAFDADNFDHHALVDYLLHDVKGKVVLSGYDNEVYKPLERKGWKRFDYVRALRANVTSGRREKRVESIWRNHDYVNMSYLVRSA